MVQHRVRVHDAARPALIEGHVELIEQLFNSIDPLPLHARDLDPQADEYIVACGEELPPDAPLAMVIHLDSTPAQDARLGMVEGAIRGHCAASAASTRGGLRRLFRRGRISLLIDGWVAMWRPMEIFLYDWWPVAARIRLLDRSRRCRCASCSAASGHRSGMCPSPAGMEGWRTGRLSAPAP
ncbi:MAG: hypothetical protein RJA36_1105 [Pseudomonadota bacterium]|jgi:hypothetical protein